MERDSDEHLRDIKSTGYLLIAEIFEIAQGENFGGTFREGTEGAAEAFFDAAFRRGRRGGGSVEDGFVDWDDTGGARFADDVERGVDGGAAQITLFELDGRGTGGLAEHTEEDSLENVFSVGSVTGDAISRAENHSVMGFKNATEFRGLRKNLVFLDYCFY